jgi:hypothetical protein
MVDKMAEALVMAALSGTGTWSRPHEVAFRSFRGVAKRSAGKGHLLRPTTDDDADDHPGLGSSTLLALFVVNCPDVVASLNDREWQRTRTEEGLLLLGELGLFLDQVTANHTTWVACKLRLSSLANLAQGRRVPGAFLRGPLRRELLSALCWRKVVYVRTIGTRLASTPWLRCCAASFLHTCALDTT